MENNQNINNDQITAVKNDYSESNLIRKQKKTKRIIMFISLFLVGIVTAAISILYFSKSLDYKTSSAHELDTTCFTKNVSKIKSDTPDGRGFVYNEEETKEIVNKLLENDWTKYEKNVPMDDSYGIHLNFNNQVGHLYLSRDNKYCYLEKNGTIRYKLQDDVYQYIMNYIYVD